MNAPVPVLAVLAVAGIALAVVFSAGETAVLRATRSAVSALIAGGSPSATTVKRFTSQRRFHAARFAFVRLIAEMTTASAITIIADRYLVNWWWVIAVSLLVNVMIAFLVVRISPRSVGRRHPVGVLKTLAPVLSFGMWLTAPFAALTRASGEDDPSEEDFTEDEIRDIIERVSESEGVEDDDGDLLRSAFELGDTYVREVMVPRIDMVTVTADTPLSKVVSLFVRSGFSRLPVVGESIDDLLGVVYFKDVIEFQRNNPDDETTTPVALARPAFFVPESKRIDDLLREMQRTATHIAIAVDEYGGVAGLVTVEDLLEEIVGELTDEHDRAEVQPEELSEGVWRVPARMPIDELGDLFDLEIDDEDVDTAGGLLAKALGKVPLRGSEADALGLHLVAERVEGRRRQVTTLLVSLPDHAEVTE